MQAARHGLRVVQSAAATRTQVQDDVIQSPWSRAMLAVTSNPLYPSVASVVAAIIAFLQSAQAVVSTLVALVTSITALVLCGIALYKAIKQALKARQEKE